MNQRNYKTIIQGIIVISLTIFLLSCDFPITTAPERPATTSLSCDVPILSALPETKLMQSKGGIEISISPVHYSTQVLIKKTVQEVEPPLLSIRPQGANRYIEVTETPIISITPDKLTFTILINNLLPRVFRGAGAVVQFSSGGKTLSLEADGYKDLSNIILPPRQQQEVLIYGPDLSHMPIQKATLGVYIFDVVTKVDAAGNISEKQNFEWYFDYSSQKHEEVVPSAKVSRGWVR